jgi:hypothetical protein
MTWRGLSLIAILWPLLFWQALGLFQRFPQNIFNLGIEGTQFIVGPMLDRFQHVRIYSERVGLFFTHGLGSVNRTGVHYRLCAAFAAQNYKEVADHGGAALRVEVNDISLGQLA